MLGYLQLVLILQLSVSRVWPAGSPITPILLAKWEQAFRYYDTDGDGIIHKSDVERVAAYLIENTPMTHEKLSELINLASDMWDVSMGRAGKTNVTLAESLLKQSQLYRSGALGNTAIRYRTHIFHAMDENNGGRIDHDEFLLFAKSLGHSDLYNQTVRFNAIDLDSKGTITLSEYLGAYVTYFTDPDVTVSEMPLFGMPKNDDRSAVSTGMGQDVGNAPAFVSVSSKMTARIEGKIMIKNV